ncbi:MAG: UDP-N-acetylmuramoyl-L-alanyl-D-glutamate--2,6-diaminopimelate ligase [Candidatus Cloacimonetes bacterium]|nr:UDP-N-acetylmuramoyl-L-alanyl-D-glutamate--2,6-diaminopimelate ligase [Candidatus Cloacimonadota bacterium]
MPSLFEVSRIIEILQSHNLYLECRNIEADRKITGLQTDSRLLSKGEAFFCLRGLETDGHNYYKQAAANGCELYICEHLLDIEEAQIIVTDSRAATSLIAREYFQIDDRQLKLVGFTGTNGKTTSAYLAWQLASKCGIKSGYIGTIGCFIADQYIETRLTTPDIIELMSVLAKMQAEKVEVVFLEASSHALSLQRLRALNFTTAIFLNLSQDHLDFHQNLEEYAASKFKLFRQLHEDGKAIVNMEDDWGRKYWEQIKGAKYGIAETGSDITYKINKIDIISSQFNLSIIGEKTKIESPLTGEFNVQNLICALAAVKLTFPHLTLESLGAAAKKISAAPGRLEKVINNQALNIYIDYAHTPDAIEKVTAALKPFVNGRLITIIGAGGNRDKIKRPAMLKAALRYSDLVIVTTDNPRYEDPISIIRDIAAGTSPEEPVWIRESREKALADGLSVTHKRDVLLITGKGHETYQDIKGCKMPFDEREKIAELLTHPEADTYDIDFDRIMVEFTCTSKISDKPNLTLKKIVTDTRKLVPQSLFIPLKGENFDGHEFIGKVLCDTSCISLCQANYNITNDNFIVVDNTLEALGKLARCYRQLLGTTVFGITGSTGKTSVKEYLAQILSHCGKTGKTNANENNFIGVAQTILNLHYNDRYAVIELGTNHFGEIDWLTRITLPDIAVITNIGASHLEFLRDTEGVFQEKKAIFAYGARICLYPGDDGHFRDYSGSSFGFHTNCKYRISKLSKTNNGYSFLINEVQYELPLTAEFQVINAVIAISAALETGISSATIKKALQEMPVLPLRLQLMPHKSGMMIIDCYNANPQSMQAAIGFWEKLEPAKPHVAILGSMLELGKQTIDFHRKIGSILKAAQFSLLISVGEEAREYEASQHYTTIEQLINSGIIETLPDDAVILIKGSHAIHLEKILERI